AVSCVGMLLAPAAQAAQLAGPRDVALQKGGVLLGQVLDAQGTVLAKSPVSVHLAGKEVARVVTDQAGNFSVPNLRGGVYQVVLAGQANACRCWAPRTAPPVAQQGLLLVANSDLVRAQNCGSGVGCGSVCGPGGGGVLNWMSCHPVITAAAIGAAIAIPLSVDDDPPSPASP
ncbi:MAG: carboxypeptidase-like regulatory domain-containing protein, partial [Pirellulales bacterium]|nr:carboxypeptidase-like regulatory domain-containing protein [Pirellulales bacterium]